MIQWRLDGDVVVDRRLPERCRQPVHVIELCYIRGEVNNWINHGHKKNISKIMVELITILVELITIFQIHKTLIMLIFRNNVLLF